METAVDPEIPDDSESNRSQVLITCHMCPKKAELFCKSCDINLCQTCAGKHMLILPIKEHTIIHYPRKYDLIPQPLCPSHTDRKCDFYCQQCDVPVCTKCILANIHKEHDIKDISIIYDAKKAFITQETQDLENVTVPGYERIIAEIQEKITDLPKQNKETKELVKKEEEKLHVMLHDAVNEHTANIDAMEKEDIAELKKELCEFQHLLEAVRQTIRENNELVATANVRIFDFQTKIETFRRIPSQLEKPPASFTPGEVDSKLLLEFIGKLEPGERCIISGAPKIVLDKPVVSEAIETSYDNLRKVCCVRGKRLAWILGIHYQSEVNNLSLVDKKGSVFDELTIPTHYSGGCDTTVTRNGNLLYSSYSEKTVNLVVDGTITQLIKTDWHPSSICFTSTDDLLVATLNNPDKIKSKSVVVHKAKVFKYLKKPNPTKKFEPSEIQLYQRIPNQKNEFEPFAVELDQRIPDQAIEFQLSAIELYECKDLKHDPILGLAGNKNADVCIADYYCHEVIIKMNDGTIRSKYTGISTCVSNQRQFSPREIATDSQGHILVTDRNIRTNTDAIHVLSMDGQFRLLIDNSKLGAITGISVDGEDNLWVIEGQKKLKIITYMR